MDPENGPPRDPERSVRRQCELPGFSRSTLYYEPAPETAEDLGLMRPIDEEYTRHPFYGIRRMAVWLKEGKGQGVNRKRVRRLMRLMGLEAIHPEPKLSAGNGHRVYPYLLRGVGSSVSIESGVRTSPMSGRLRGSCAWRR